MSGSNSLFTSPNLTSSASSALSGQLATSTGANSNALSQLSSNYNNFLQLLMTQLKNQDPSSPMDANQFTQELVEFSSVEQQINTNSSLTQLIQLTQQDGLLQSSALVGKQVVVTNSDMPLQNGKGTVQFTAPADEAVNIGVYASSGALLATASMNASQGTNSWTWDGKTSNGTHAADGGYKVVITPANASSASAALTISAVGTVTGVKSSGSVMQLLMGSVSDPITNVQQVLN